MHDELKQTRKFVRRSKVMTDERGAQDQLREVAQGPDGVLARDADKGRFEIIGDEELQHILDGTDLESTTNPTAATSDKSAAKVVIDEPELELVSTQFLRTILDPADSEQTAESGFDPYDHS